MNGRVRATSGHVETPINEGWEVAATAPSAVDGPLALERAALSWTRAAVPTTAAGALRAAGAWSLDGPPRRFDAEDWWWRVTFSGGERDSKAEVSLCFDGLATLADVWLNGEHLLETDNMFVGYEKPVKLADCNELVIRCRSVDAALKTKRPRPRWRAPMIESAQLRWLRTTLLGRTPGWSPPAAAVGPWRPIRLVERRGIVASDVSLRTRLDAGAGILEVSAHLRDVERGGPFAGSVELVLARAGRELRAPLHALDRVDRVPGSFDGRLVVADVERWWPHTHGDPALYAARLEAGGVRVDLGNVGFRDVTADRTNDGFALHVNGARIFCRGACWTPLDAVTLCADAAANEAAVAQAACAGMNMLRVAGTMVYESDAFFDAVDAAGILVWQDLMFANMDYPEDDPGFAASATREVREQLRRLQGRPSVAVICGNSEGEQQAAMFGASRDRWSPKLFHETLASLSADVLADVPYWPSSAHGGAFPHQADCGTTSYYGVGAYQRPLEDARRAEVRFATECLAFANVPPASTLAKMPGGESLRAHHPTWKARVPRDLGAGWDFDDVRDHYVARLFRVDPTSLRYADHERYLALGRVVTGEVMAHVFGEWRRARATCAGGLVLFLRDLWPGSGWGVIGADGTPKAAYCYLRRALAPLALHISDEGGNGLVVHACNDGASRLEGELEIALYRGDAKMGRGVGAVIVPARGAIEVPTLSLFDGFMDLGHAYRFGPPTCDLVVATLRVGAVTVEAFHFPLGLPSGQGNPGIEAVASRREDRDLDLTIRSRGFAQSVAIELGGFVPDDDFFHMAPGSTRTVRLRPASGQVAAARLSVFPLNAESATSASIPRE